MSFILSLGGSLIAPDKVDYFFLREFKNFILRQKGQFIIVCGGGKTNTYYNEAAQRISNIKKEDLDWIGIMATRLNAELVRAIFGELSYKKVIINPSLKRKINKQIIVAAGWKPGWSTDYVAVCLAENFGSREIINLSNIDYIYDKDPKKFKDAKPISKITWEDYLKLIGSKWTPRLNSPFDPIASKKAKKLGIRVIVLNGRNLKNLEKYFLGREFIGSMIE